jgi:hypothetical protein
MRGTGRTISFMGEAPFVDACREDISHHHATYPVHEHPIRSCALHSTNGRWFTPGVTPYSPPPCVFPPIQHHASHSYLDAASVYTNPSSLIWGAPLPEWGAHPGQSHAPLAASHQTQSTCGYVPQRLTCSPQANGAGSSHILPGRIPYSTGPLHSHFAPASSRPVRSQSAPAGHAPSRANLSTTVTSPCSPAPVPLTTRSDTPPSCRDESETTEEEKLPSGK